MFVIPKTSSLPRLLALEMMRQYKFETIDNLMMSCGEWHAHRDKQPCMVRIGSELKLFRRRSDIRKQVTNQMIWCV